MNRPTLSRLLCLVALAPALGPTVVAAEEGPIRLHPDNPRWFQWRDETGFAGRDDAIALGMVKTP